MKRIIFALAALVLMISAVCGCSGQNSSGVDDLPKLADDPEIIKKWDEYDMLDGLPRYSSAGIFENVYVGQDGTVVVSYVGVPAEDYVSYTDELKSAGCELQEGSAVWLTEGMMGVPIFDKGNKEITLVWNMNNDTLDISVSNK